MKLDPSIAPTQLRDYAKSRGWQLVKKMIDRRLYVMNHPKYERRQLVFPMDTTAPDYAEAVLLSLEKLAVLEERSPEAILKSLIEVGDDALSFRVTSDRIDERSIPLSFAASMLSGAQQLLLASACTVVKPQPVHRRMSRSEAQQFLETARFRHTQPGSFVLNVSCPVQAMDGHADMKPSLLPNEPEIPFVRKTTMVLKDSLKELVAAIESDTLDSLVDHLKKDNAPQISSNFCEALANLHDDAIKNTMDISITWAALIPPPAEEAPVSIIRLPDDYFPRIAEVAQELRSTETHSEDTFVGTVERLDGEMGNDGRRSGEVVLSLLLPEGDQIRARTVLNADQYAQADVAHMQDGKYIKVTGRLQAGRQPRQLTDLSSFELIS
jgi:hypothetical protein